MPRQTQRQREALAARVMTNPTQLYTTAEAGDLLGLSESQVARLAHNGRIQAWQDEHGARAGAAYRWLIEASTLAHYILRPHQPARSPVPTLDQLRARHAAKLAEQARAKATA